MSVSISSLKRCWVRFYLQLFFGWAHVLFTVRYLCLFAHSDVQYILCCVFVLFVFVLCTLCFSGLPLRYSLTFIYMKHKRKEQTSVYSLHLFKRWPKISTARLLNLFYRSKLCIVLSLYNRKVL